MEHSEETWLALLSSMDHASFRDALKAHIERDDIEIARLARATGVERTVITRFLNGTRESIRFDHAIALVAFWRETVEEFLGAPKTSDPRERLRNLSVLLSDDEARFAADQLEGMLAHRRPRK